MEGAGFTFVEVLSCCPTNWGMTPAEGHRMAEGEHDSLLSLWESIKDITAEVK